MSPDVIRIFVSSPGDVGEERVMTERVVQRLQGEFGQSVKLEPILWEHEPMRATQHPQEQIPLPSECDIVVCLLWSRLGTRLPDQISAAGKTGTEWEFEEAARSFLEKKTPDLLVYRKTKEVVASVRDDLTYEEKKNQWNALSRFLTHWFKAEDGTFNAVFKTFEGLDQFEDLLERDLRKLIQERLKLTPLAEKTWHQAPFRGLEVFDFEHAPIFFGRTRAIGAIREALVQQSGQGCAFVLVFGMSGVGKSSLVRAGVLPTLTQPGVIEGVGLWRWCVFRPSDATGELCDGLASALMTSPALPELAEAGVDARTLAKLLREAPEQAALPISVGLKRAAETTAAAERLLKAPVSRLALVIDPMEELFSSDRVTESQRVGFVKALSALARSGLVWIIGTMRSDFYPRCAEISELAALKSSAGQFDLLPPTAPELAQMIGFPARAAGLRFEEKPTGERLDHVLQETALRDPQALPLLEFTLAELYKACSKERPPSEPVVLTFAAYDQLGGMEGALARRAEEEFAKLSANVQAAMPAVFRALVTVRHGEEEAMVAQPVLREVFADAADQNAMVEAFVQARLFTSDRTGAEEKPMVRLAHEALLRCWPRLDQWLKANREFLRIRARVSEQAKRWQTEGRLSELLLAPGKPLAEGEFLLAQKQKLDRGVADYIQQSHQSAARKRRRRQFVTTAFVLSLLIGMIGSSFFAWQSNQNAMRADKNAEDEKKARKKADKTAEANKLLAEEADKRREQAEKLALHVRFESLHFRFRDDVGLGMVAAAMLLPEASRLNDRDFVDSVSLHLGVWSQETHRLKHIFSHTHRVVAVAYSPDGKTVLSGSGDKTARLWETATGKPFGPPLQHQGWVHAVAFSRDGKTVLTGSLDATARLWETATGKQLGPPLQHQGEVRVVAFSPDGTTVLTGSNDKTARLWETATGMQIGPPLKHEASVDVVAFSPDGTTVLTGSNDKTARLWETATGMQIGPPLKHQAPILAAAFSPDGKTVLTGTYGASAHLWETATGKPFGPPLHHQGDIVAVTFSRDGKIALTASRHDRTARMWVVATSEPFGPPLQHEDEVRAAAFSPDGKTVLTGSYDKTARLWERTTGKPIGPPLRHQDFVTTVAFSPDGKTVLTGSYDKTARLWETATGKQLGPPLQHGNWVNAVAFSPDGKTVLTGSDGPTTRLWETATGKPLGWSLPQGRVLALAFSPDGKTMLTGSFDKTARLWETLTGKQFGTPLHHQEKVNAVAFTRDGKTVLTGSRDKTARLWETATSKPLGPPLQHQGEVFAVAFSPDGKVALTASRDRTARMWVVATSKPFGPPLHHEGEVQAVAFSQDGTTVLTGGYKSARLWETATGKPLGPPLQHQNSVVAVAFSRDGKTVLTGSWEKTARLWEAATGKPVGPPLQHQDWVNAVAFSPDGTTVLTGSNDETARLWETATGKPLGPPMQHQPWVVAAGLGPPQTFQGSVVAVAFSPDGKAALTGSHDNTARLWRVPRPIEGDPERILLWAQVITGLELDEYGGTRGLDAAAWQQRRQRLQELGGPPNGD